MELDPNETLSPTDAVVPASAPAPLDEAGDERALEELRRSLSAANRKRMAILGGGVAGALTVVALLLSSGPSAPHVPPPQAEPAPVVAEAAPPAPAAAPEPAAAPVVEAAPPAPVVVAAAAPVKPPARASKRPTRRAGRGR